MTTEIWRVHILWIFQITKITRAKSPIQNCLRDGFQERVGIISVVISQLRIAYFSQTPLSSKKNDDGQKIQKNEKNRL